jgi:hypothetical protein
MATGRAPFDLPDDVFRTGYRRDLLADPEFVDLIDGLLT